MAPYKKLTQKEIRLAQMPWITQGLLVSMRVRDKLYKQTKDNSVTNDIIVLYKRYRNMIVNLLRISRNKYYPVWKAWQMHAEDFFPMQSYHAKKRSLHAKAFCKSQ